jgi:hypothetical protein
MNTYIQDIDSSDSDEVEGTFTNENGDNIRSNANITKHQRLRSWHVHCQSLSSKKPLTLPTVRTVQMRSKPTGASQKPLTTCFPGLSLAVHGPLSPMSGGIW